MSFDRGDHRGDRDRDRDREPRVQTAKGRLRAKHRKKQRRRKTGAFARRRVCRFCADASIAIDYKDPRNLRFFVAETGKLVPSRISGNCARHQRKLTEGIHRARMIALLPFTASQG
jgi:small subunit ribosomal protein S18